MFSFIHPVKKCILLFVVLMIAAEPALAVKIRIQVSQDSDDAEEDGGNMTLGSSDLDFEDTNIVGIRFQSLDIPQGATILSAFIQLVADDSDSSSASWTIEGEELVQINNFMKKINGQVNGTEKRVEQG